MPQPSRSAGRFARSARHWISRLSVTVVFVVPAVAVPSTAHATTYGYDGSDPNATSCANPDHASTIDGIAIDPPNGPDAGWLELRWSSSCLTAWARFTCNDFLCSNYRIWIHRNNDGKEESVSVSFPRFTANGAQLYTLQLYDGGGISAKACFRLTDDPSAPTHCTSPF